jgi:hypothetical protein
MARNKVKRNVVALCSVPKGQPGRPSKSLTLAQAKAVLDAAEGNPLYAYIVVSLLVGARTEELRELAWDHVDLDGDPDADPPVPPSIRVWRSVRERGDTKTKKSRRTLALPLRGVTALREHRRMQDCDREAASAGWHESSDQGGGLPGRVLAGCGPRGRPGRAHRQGTAWLTHAGTTRRCGSVSMRPGRYPAGQPHPVPQPRHHDQTGHQYGHAEVPGGRTRTEPNSYQRHHHGQYGDPAPVHQLAPAGPDHHAHRPASIRSIAQPLPSPTASGHTAALPAGDAARPGRAAAPCRDPTGQPTPDQAAAAATGRGG